MAGAEKAKVLEKLMELKPDLTEQQAADCVDRAQAYFLEQTKRGSVPVRAFWLWVDLTLAMCEQSADGDSRQVSSIKRGDTTIQYQESAIGLDALVPRVLAYRTGVVR